MKEEYVHTLISLFDEVYASPHALSYDTYVDQLTVTNYWLFKKIFSHYKKFVPNLVFLSQEMIVLFLIKKYHLHNTTTLSRLLFDPKFEQLLYKHFEGFEGTFDRKKKYGTYLFWALPKDGKYRQQLWRKGNYLQTEDGSYKLLLTPEAVSLAIERHELIPSVLVVYIVLALYYGLILGGGPAQTMILPNVKEKYTQMLKEAKDTESIEACQGLITDSMIVSRPSMAYIETEGVRVPATGLDLYLYGQKGDDIRAVLESTKSVTLEEIIERALQSFYHEFVPGSEKEEQFSQITAHDIEIFTKLDKKIPPWGKA